MSTRMNKPANSASVVIRTPLGIEVYRPTKLDSVCRYTVGSFIAAGAAFAAVNVSASSASADEFGGGFSDSSVGTVSFSDISLASGSVSDSSTFTPTLSDFTAPATLAEVTPDVFQAAEPIPDQSFNLVPVPDIMQVTAPAPEESAVVTSSGEVAFAAPDPPVEVPASAAESAPAVDGGLASEFPQLALTDFQPTDSTVDSTGSVNPIDVLGLPIDRVFSDPELASVLQQSDAVEFASVVPELRLGSESAFDFINADLSADPGIAGFGVQSSVTGLSGDLLFGDAALATDLRDAPPVEGVLVASAGDLSSLSQLGLNLSGNLDTPVGGATYVDAAPSETTDLLLAATPPEEGSEKSVWKRLGEAINGGATLYNVLFPIFGLPKLDLPKLPPGEPTPVVEDRDKRGTDNERSGLEDAAGDGPEGDPPPDPPTTGKQPPGGAPDPGNAPTIPFQLPELDGGAATYSYSSYVAKPFVPEPESTSSSTQDAQNQPVIFDSSFGKAPVWQIDPAAQKVPNTPAVAPSTETSWTQMAVPAEVMEQQSGNLFGYPMPAASQPAQTTPIQSVPPAPVATWSNIKAPTTPFVFSDSSSQFGDAASQPAKVTPAVTTKPTAAPTTTTQPVPQANPTPDPGVAPKGGIPVVDQILDGTEWALQNSFWGAVKVGEIGGKVISPLFGGWSTQP